MKVRSTRCLPCKKKQPPTRHFLYIKCRSIYSSFYNRGKDYHHLAIYRASTCKEETSIAIICLHVMCIYVYIEFDIKMLSLYRIRRIVYRQRSSSRGE